MKVQKKTVIYTDTELEITSATLLPTEEAEALPLRLRKYNTASVSSGSPVVYTVRPIGQYFNTVNSGFISDKALVLGKESGR